MSVDKNVGKSLQAWAIKCTIRNLLQTGAIAIVTDDKEHDLDNLWTAFKIIDRHWNGSHRSIEAYEADGFSAVRVRISEVGASPRQSSKEGE